MKIILVTEILSLPFDEGLKNVVYALYRNFKDKSEALVITDKDNDTGSMNVTKVYLNKAFVSIRLLKIIHRFSPDVILYVPEASCTFNSFLRAKILKLMSRHSRIIMLCAQHRTYSIIQNSLIKHLLRPDLLFLLSKKYKKTYQVNGINVEVLPLAVDNVKFSSVSTKEKDRLRADFNIPSDKTVVLHVGHIKVNRNIECLIEIQKIENVHVVIVGSTSMIIENDFKNKLVKAGIRIIDEFIPDISNIYKMSDIYVFPVVSNKEAIDMPLSVLEAMACNLPVITTRFGALVDNFSEDAGFRYYDRTEELMELIELFKNMSIEKICNNEKVKPYTWHRFTDQVVSSCNKLL